MTNLTISCARQRMIRGETQYNKVSRFVKEIPGNLLGGSGKREIEEPRETSTRSFQQAGSRVNPIFAVGKANQSKPYQKKLYQNTSFSSSTTSSISLEYGNGDRVKHIKFGEGTVVQIVEGGRDYEVTVDFDRVGIKKMFASFAKLKKV